MNESSGEQNRDSFGGEIFHNLIQPWKRSGFGMYFVLFIITLGGFDIWWALYEQSKNEMRDYIEVFKNASSYSLTLICVSFADLLLNEKIQHKASMTFLSVFIILFSIILFLISCYWGFYYSLFASLFAVFLGLCSWVISNAENEKLTDDYYNKNSQSIAALEKSLEG